jgi:hypothetical protein
MSIAYGGDNITFPDASTQNTSPKTGFVNRIINGAMTIDQRNAGASVTPTVDAAYTLDRWSARLSVASKYSVQQVSTAPTGFVNSLLVTSLSAYTVGSSEFFSIVQNIEGFNTSDLAWGTASAATITLSFQVRSSLTGTFGGVIRNYDGSRSYPFTYTISSANTFEYKTITIAGDTSGTWATTNSGSLQVIFNLGAGATVSGTAGAWSASGFRSATGATSVVGTSGATFYITGVQLEKGSVATPFEFRSIGTELALCQRYFEVYRTDAASTSVLVGQAFASTSSINVFSFKTEKRAAPTFSSSGTWNALNSSASNAGGTIGMNSANIFSSRLDITGASGLTAGHASILFCNTSGGTLQFSSEL